MKKIPKKLEEKVINKYKSFGVLLLLLEIYNIVFAIILFLVKYGLICIFSYYLIKLVIKKIYYFIIKHNIYTNI